MKRSVRGRRPLAPLQLMTRTPPTTLDIPDSATRWSNAETDIIEDFRRTYDTLVKPLRLDSDSPGIPLSRGLTSVESVRGAPLDKGDKHDSAHAEG